VSVQEEKPPRQLHPVPETEDGLFPLAHTAPGAEQAVLGAILLAPEQADAIEPELEPTDFHQPRHETIWRAIHAVRHSGAKPDPVLVAEDLTRNGQIARVGGGPYLYELMAACPLPDQAHQYARLVRDAARLRNVAQIATRLNQVVNSAAPDAIDDALAQAVDDLDAAVARFGPRTTRAGRIDYIDFDGFFTRPRQRADWIIAPILATGRVTLLYSPGKHGKSLIAMEVAAAVAAGRTALATHAVAPPRHVLYLDQEMTEDDWADRLGDMGYSTCDEHRLADHLHLAQLQAWPPLDTAAGGAMLQGEAKRVAAAVVVIDTISKLIVGEENSNDTQQALYRHTIVPLKRAGIAVLVLDHTGKDTERGARGGSAKTDNIDLAFELLLRGRDTLTLRCSHARFRDESLTHPTFLRRMTGPLTHVIEERASTDHGPGLRPTHIMEKVSRYIEINPGVSRRLIESAKLGKHEYVRMAVELLLIEGYIEIEKGPHNAQQHRQVKPYRESEND
jgi:hypothetical protein